MATDCVKYIPGLKAGGVIKPYRMVKGAAGNKVVKAVANTTRIIGVCYSDAKADDAVDVASVEGSTGPVLIECGGAIVAGKFATPDAEGKAVTADDGRLQALQAYADGDIGEFYPTTVVV